MDDGDLQTGHGYAASVDHRHRQHVVAAELDFAELGRTSGVHRHRQPQADPADRVDDELHLTRAHSIEDEAAVAGNARAREPQQCVAAPQPARDGQPAIEHVGVERLDTGLPRLADRVGHQRVGMAELVG
ncbi:MAG: hypothetical protein IPM29_17650 [Planctomycetes bacterium]|nr:hypothetical protein [Planctomycetota bacterium]